MAARKTIEEQLAAMKQRRLEKIKQIQIRDKEKLKILNKRLAKIEAERTSEAGKALKKLYKECAGALDIKDVIAVCEKHWPAPKEQKNSPARSTAAAA
ncbi:MAG: hypothetical protein PHW12_04665 [Smithella sp.]|nr:hypothetical protein [Smithella sp.]MDD5672647.1 hypothetical protein [Chitinivibrionales bacterium]